MYKTHSCCGSPTKELGIQIVPAPHKSLSLTANPCKGQKPKDGSGFDNFECMKDGVVAAAEQAGADVTAGYQGKWMLRVAHQSQTPTSRRACVQSTCTGT